jgi:hypothetical protein
VASGNERRSVAFVGGQWRGSVVSSLDDDPFSVRFPPEVRLKLKTHVFPDNHAVLEASDCTHVSILRDNESNRTWVTRAVSNH